MDGRITDAVAALSLVAPDVLALRDVTLGRALGESPADRKSGITYCIQLVNIVQVIITYLLSTQKGKIQIMPDGCFPTFMFVSLLHL